MKDFLHHLFLPHYSNNHRAKVLHHKSLLFLVVGIFVSQFFLSFLQHARSDVLGVSSNIAVSDLLSLTNQKRSEAGLQSLTLSNTLSNAAAQKATDMFTKNYWAHNAPDGTTPWVFIKSVGYDYLYAGENLARGFSTSQDVVDAWMASPGHRENMMSKNYQDIGFAIVPGTLTGDQTILVVEMFGSPRTQTEQPEVGVAKQEAPPVVFNLPSQENNITQVAKSNSAVESLKTTPLIDAKKVTKNTSMMLILALLILLLLDLAIIKRKKIVRVISHNIDTLLYLTILLITIIIIGNGTII